MKKTLIIVFCSLFVLMLLGACGGKVTQEAAEAEAEKTITADNVREKAAELKKELQEELKE